MRLLLSLIFSLFTAQIAMAKDNVTHFTLDNGLQVVLIEDHRAPIVVHMLWYRAGAADDPAGTSGIAHFLEHLMFKATNSMPSGAFSRVVAQTGGEDNAFTSADYTAYFQFVAAEHLEKMMQMEADRMRNLKLTAADVDIEREVILEERASRIDSNQTARFREQVQASLYQNHPYARPVIGWRSEMQSLSRDDALSFYRRYYAPNNAILVVSGDVTPDQIKVLATKHYGALSPTKNLQPRQRPREPEQMAERRVRFEGSENFQPYFERRYVVKSRVPNAQKPSAALVYLSHILGGGPSSVLAKALQQRDQLVRHIHVSYNPIGYDSSILAIRFSPVSGVGLATVEKALDREIDQFLAQGIDLELFDRLKFQLRAGEIFRKDDLMARAQEYGRALATDLSIEDVLNWPNVLDAITPQDVMEVATDSLDKNWSVTGWAVPQGGEKLLSEGGK